MLSLPTLRSYHTEFVAQRLHDLGRHFTLLHGRVRQAALEAIRETLAEVTRDAVDHLLLRHLPERTPPSTAHGHHEDYDPWAEHDESYRDTWTEPEPRYVKEPKAT